MDQPLFSSNLNAELSRDSLSHGKIRVGRGSSHHILCSRPFPDGHGCNGPSAGLKNIEESFGRARRDFFLKQPGTKGDTTQGLVVQPGFGRSCLFHEVNLRPLQESSIKSY